MGPLDTVTISVWNECEKCGWGYVPKVANINHISGAPEVHASARAVGIERNRPPQTPAASFKSPYRKRLGAKQFRSTRTLRDDALVDRVLRFSPNKLHKFLASSAPIRPPVWPRRGDPVEPEVSDRLAHMFVGVRQ